MRRAAKVPLADHRFDALGSICYTRHRRARKLDLRQAGQCPRRRAAISQAILAWREPAEIIYRHMAEADQFQTPYATAASSLVNGLD